MHAQSDLEARDLPGALFKLSREHVNVEILEGRGTALVAEHLKHVRELLPLLRVLAWWNGCVVRRTWS